MSIFEGKMRKFVNSMDKLPPSLTAFRGMLAMAFVVGATSYAEGDIDDHDLTELTHRILDEFESWPKEH